ncbi:MAG: lyso-ornithine lipid acyltransferase [Burkholderiales bacterium RIFCSPHIGHO2_12_FULL_69_20]|nr:MAG: lyso-ornithine lipid acyltransferase [Burkholderiales bacterium RIFCSPHIGHO2_12_FULL_69_20]
MRALLALLALWRVLRVVLHVLLGMAVMALRFPSLDAAGRHARIGWWSAGLLRAIGVGLQVRGTARPGAGLLLANHVSWLDVAALHAAVPQARFVSKADVLHWPLLGWLVAGAGTLFIERERKRDALRVVHAMAEALRAGETVAVFPEGTTGPGPELLPFHANLLQAAIATATPIQPAVLRFADPHHAFSPAAAFVGETTLLQSLWRVATARGLVAHVELLAPQASAHADRRALAEHLRALMAERLGRSGAPLPGGTTVLD